jgi:ABC-2 type transport system ATP-binding protein
LVLKDVSFELAEGEIVGFVGPNGAGKSTTIKVITGLVSPDSGITRIGGFMLASAPQAYLRRLGVLIESPASYPALTAWDHLAYLARIRKCYNPTLINSTLDRVGLRHHSKKRVSQFSTGMRQRLAVAMAILHGPRILILDEPTNGLDPAATIEMRTLIGELAREHDMAVLISTHLLHEIEMICNRVLFIRGGMLVSSRALTSNGHNDEARVIFVTSDPERTVAVISERFGASSPVIRDSHVECQLSKPDVARVVTRLVEEAIDVYEAREKRESLEEIYVRTLGTSRHVE